MKTRHHRITAPNEDVYGKIDEFFEGTEKEIGVRDGPSEFERKIYGLCEPFDSTEPARRMDGNTQILLYKGRVVALVIETRTEFNYVEFTFFKNLEDII